MWAVLPLMKAAPRNKACEYSNHCAMRQKAKVDYFIRSDAYTTQLVALSGSARFRSMHLRNSLK